MKTARAALLAATDFSAAASRAVDRAVLLAREAAAGLTVLHVVSRFSLDRLLGLVTGQAGDAERRLLAEARADLDRLLETIGPRGVSGTGEVAVGAVPDEIAAAAERLDAGLVVVGATGAGAVRELFLGATPVRVSRRMARPLLTVRRPVEGPYRSVLVPVDFSASSLTAVILARALAPQAAVTVLHAFEVPFEAKLRYAGVAEDSVEGYRSSAREQAARGMSTLVDRLGADGNRVTPELVHGYAPHVILQTAEALGCGLIVMGKRGLSAVEDLLLGSVTQHVLEHARADVLVVGESATPGAGRAGGA